MKKILLKRGFTIIELLVVIAIIAVMTAIVTSNFTTAKSKARDAKRVSDIAQIQLVLAMIFDKCNVYPADITNMGAAIRIDNSTLCSIGSGNSNYTLSYFISNMPKDPVTNASYGYSKNSAMPYNDYVLKAVLENNSPVLLDDADGNPFTIGANATAGCDDNNAGANTNGPFNYCVQPK